MKKLIVTLLLLSMTACLLFANGGQEASADEFTLWTKEGEADGGLQLVQALAEEFGEEHGVNIVVVQKDVEALREDFLNASLAGDPPDLLWTVSDHAGPFVTAGVVQPVDDLVDTSDYVAAPSANGNTYGVPISAGNHLMLMYNRSLVPEAPQNTDEMIEMGEAITDGDVWGIVWNQTEPFWLVPWLGGFGGSVFAADGVTPTLDTPAMVGALQLLHDIKYEYEITPPECDYNAMDTLFKEGLAGMIVNGDWALGQYEEILGDDLGVAPIPMVSETGEWPAAYTSGVYFMVPEGIDGPVLDVLTDFMLYVTSIEQQERQLNTLNRLPGLREALESDAVTDDPLLAASAEAMSYGVPMPTVLEMRCNWDSMKPELIAVLNGQQTPEAAAEAMQSAAESCVQSQQ
ncbi:MAG: extracellular solute-binding protein [Spirochaetia bacterium]